MTVQVEPGGIWRRWTRLELRNEDEDYTTWVRPNGPLAVGTTGRVKPRRGPASALTIAALDEPARFDCRTRLPGASMRFEHQLEPTATGTAFAAGARDSAALTADNRPAPRRAGHLPAAASWAGDCSQPSPALEPVPVFDRGRRR